MRIWNTVYMKYCPDKKPNYYRIEKGYQDLGQFSYTQVATQALPPLLPPYKALDRAWRPACGDMERKMDCSQPAHRFQLNIQSQRNNKIALQKENDF